MDKEIKKMTFEVQPSSIEPLLVLSFGFEYDQEIDNEQVVWANDSVVMAKEFQDALSDILQVDAELIFNKFYDNPSDDIGLFVELTKLLNHAGFYVYNGADYYAIYKVYENELANDDVVLALKEVAA